MRLSRLPRGIEWLTTHKRKFLKELELTEGRCTGINKIINAMAKNGSPAPEFEFDHDHSYFMVRLPVHLLARPPCLETRTDQVTAQVAALIRVVEGEMKRTEIQAALGLTHSPHFRQAYLQPSLAAGLLEMTLADKPNSRLQKYRLTQRGRIWRIKNPP
jgi:ATP-dependent DNA helicase RecG